MEQILGAIVKMPRLRFIKSIFSEQTLIAWMMLVAIIPMLLLAYFAYSSAQATLKDTISSVLLMEIKKKVGLIDSYITEKKIDIMQFTELPELVDLIKSSEQQGHLDNLNPDKMANFVNYLKYIAPKIGVSDLCIVNMDRKIVYVLKDKQVTGRMLSEDTQAHIDLYRSFDGARILRMPYLFTSFHGKAVAGLNIYLANVIRVNGITKAIFIMKLNAFDIEKIIKHDFGYTKSDQTLLAMMVNNKPTMVIKTEQKKDNDSDQVNALALKAIQGEMGHPVELEHRGRPVYAIYSYVPQFNMGMIIEYDKAEVYQKIHWLKVNILTITTIDLLMIIMIVLWISKELKKAQMKSELLLENILPKFVIDELKEKKQFLARSVKNVSVFFVDIVQFSNYSLSKTPELVVNELDELFSILDRLCEKYQLEKIKTIGDAYMAVAGLIMPQIDHASRAIDMGLDAIEAVKEYNLNHGTSFELRVGVNSGDVVAGIIGKKKFSYDLWGNAVNCASRMESTGVTNSVQITSATYAALPNKSAYIFEQRKNVVVKGFGEMDTYLVSRKKKLDAGE